MTAPRGGNRRTKVEEGLPRTCAVCMSWFGSHGQKGKQEACVCVIGRPETSQDLDHQFFLKAIFLCISDLYLEDHADSAVIMTPASKPSVAFKGPSGEYYLL